MTVDKSNVTCNTINVQRNTDMLKMVKMWNAREQDPRSAIIMHIYNVHEYKNSFKINCPFQ